MISNNRLFLKAKSKTIVGFKNRFPNKFYIQPKTQENTKTLENTEKKKEQIICKFCGHHITLSQDKIYINGQHQHVFMNPVGVVYEIVCFSSANGCVQKGSPTINYSWFRGYSWRFALCSGCFNHLGWFYQSVHDSFYGLIYNHLSNLGVRS